MNSIPRCPNGILAKLACVTQKCNASPFICQANSVCFCNNAHQFCKTMKWTSITQLFFNYQQNLPQMYKLFIKRVQKIYNNIINKLNTEMKIFHEYLQQKLYGSQYSKIKHHLNKQNYNQITCYNLGIIISKMTQKIFDKNSSQQGFKNLQKFTINQMKILDNQIQYLLSKVEQLYKDKFRVIQRQLAEINQRQMYKNSSHGYSQSIRMVNNNSNMSSYNEKSKDFNVVQNLKGFSQTHSIVLKRSESSQDKKLFNKTTQTKFFNKSTVVKNNSQFAQTKDTQFWNPSSPIKSDLTYPKHINSKIISNASVLNHLLQRKPKQYKLIFRASQSNYQIQEFYKNMTSHTFANEGYKTTHNNDLQPITLLLLRTQYNKILGGFTKLKWLRKNNHSTNDDQSEEQSQKNMENYKQDIRGTSFLFSVDLNQKYQLINPKYGIYCGRKSIGFGKNDIRIVNHSQKHSKNYIGFPSSYNNGKYLPIKKSSLILSGSHDNLHFKVTQWEMFQVIFNNNQKQVAQNKLGKSHVKNNSVSTLSKDTKSIIKQSV